MERIVSGIKSLKGRPTVNKIVNSRKKRRFASSRTTRPQALSVNNLNKEGGFKSLSQGSVVLSKVIETYDQMILTLSGNYRFKTNSAQNLDLAAELNNLEEFASLRENAFKYKVTGVRISFDFSAKLPPGTLLSKLVIYPKTDLIQEYEPLINRNSMVLSMARKGTKNFWFNLNKGNMFEDHVDWIPAENNYQALLKIYLAAQGENLNPTENNLVLGTVKLSFIVKYSQKDIYSYAYKVGQEINRLIAGERALLDRSPFLKRCLLSWEKKQKLEELQKKDSDKTSPEEDKKEISSDLRQKKKEIPTEEDLQKILEEQEFKTQIYEKARQAYPKEFWWMKNKKIQDIITFEIRNNIPPDKRVGEKMYLQWNEFVRKKRGKNPRQNELEIVPENNKEEDQKDPPEFKEEAQASLLGPEEEF